MATLADPAAAVTADRRSLQVIGLTLAALSLAATLIAAVVVHHAVTAGDGASLGMIRSTAAATADAG